MNHIKSISKLQPALASSGTQKDVIVAMEFLVDVLAAVNSLIVRKTPSTS